MNDLLRELAPISSAAWAAIEEEAKRTLSLTLAARKLVDFTGPLGRSAAALPLGRLEPLREAPDAGIQAALLRAQPLVEFRAVFDLERRELEVIGRGAKDPDLKPVTEAARRMAMAEDRAVFHGYPAGQIPGIFQASAENMLTLTDDFVQYPVIVARALSRLRNAGVSGPYGIALGPRCHTGLTETTSGGYPVYEHVRRLLNGPIIWAPGVDGAVVLSQRGGDFELTVGQDLSIGYLDHSESLVRLYLQETFTFQALAPEAAVPLSYA